MAKLVVYQGRTKQLVQELRGKELTVGRLRSCHIQLEDQLVSRRHARFFQAEDGAWWVEDLQTKQGVWREDERIDKAPLLAGDVLIIGQHLLLYEMGSLAPEEWEVSKRARKRMTGPGDESTATLPRVTIEHLVKKAQVRAKCHLVVDLGDGPEGLPLERDLYRIGFTAGCDVRLRGGALRLRQPELVLLRDGLGRWFARAAAGKVLLNGKSVELGLLEDRDSLEIGGRAVRFQERLFPTPGLTPMQ